MCCFACFLSKNSVPSGNRYYANQSDHYNDQYYDHAPYLAATLNDYKSDPHLMSASGGGHNGDGGDDGADTWAAEWGGDCGGGGDGGCGGGGD